MAAREIRNDSISGVNGVRYTCIQTITTKIVPFLSKANRDFDARANLVSSCLAT